MTYLLDTTVLIDALRARRNRRQQLAELNGAGHVLAASVVNVAEVYAGMRAGEEAHTASLFRDLQLYEVTEAIARRAGMLKNAEAKRGRTFGLADMLVAATAMEAQLTIITDNRKDFTVPGLKLLELA